MCIKLDFKEIFLKLATNGQSDKAFLLTSKFCPQVVDCPCSEAIHMYKIIKNSIKSDFKEIDFKLAPNWQIDKAFPLTSKFGPQGGGGGVCPCPAAILLCLTLSTRSKLYQKTVICFENRFCAN